MASRSSLTPGSLDRGPRWRRRFAGGALLPLAHLLGCGGDPTLPDPTEDQVGAVAQRAVANRNFGLHCTETYEAGWLSNQPEGFTICDRFAAEASEEATQEYYYNLVDKQFYWETGGDGYDNSIEDVDLFFAFTTGAITTTRARWAMWDQIIFADSTSMELGDELRGTSVLATYSKTVLANDGATWTRWGSIFGGGLRIALASHSLLYTGSAERDVGKVFAQYLNAGYTFKTSWVAGFDEMAYNHNDVAVMATGTSASNCTYRRDSLSWDNFSNAPFPRLVTGQIAAWCMTYWDDI